MIPKFKAVWKDKVYEVCAIDWMSNVVDLERGNIEVPFGEVELIKYTGLRDKNDNEVYSGDIVNIHIFYSAHDPETLGVYEGEEEIEKVLVQHGNAYDRDVAVYSFFVEYKDEIISLADLDLHEESFEVIGNIYENPELLEDN